MTTLVRTRQPLQVLSMSNLPERRSKRLAVTSSPSPEEEPEPKRRRGVLQLSDEPAATGRKKRKQNNTSDADPFATTTKTKPAVYDEQDGDFLFTRGSKRVKTAPAAAAPSPPPPEPEAEPEPVRTQLPKRPAGRPPKNSSKKRVIPSSPPPVSPPAPAQAKLRGGKAAAATPVAAPATRRTSKRKSSLAATAQPIQDEEPALPKAKTRRKGRESAADKRLREQEEEAAQAHLMNGIPEEEEEEEGEEDKLLPAPPQTNPRRGPKSQIPTISTRATPQSAVPPTQTIALPFSDTPIQNRNKEFRKKGGNSGGRRSSLGLRGRRASSLIDNGQSALPHKTVDPSEFWKYIAAEGPSEPRRMKQLLIWCGERALSEKPRGGDSRGAAAKGNSAVLGARAIQDQILKDFGSVSEFSDWFSREDDEEKKEMPKREVVLQPNPINVQNDEKIAALEARIARLKSLKSSWLSLHSSPLPITPPIIPPSSAPNQPPQLPSPPDPSLLSQTESEMLSYLTNPTTHFGGFKRQVRSRLQNAQATLEYQVDLLADRVHKFDMRVKMGEREAETVLKVSAERLKEREEREKRKVGTVGVNVMEVLRSLGRVVGEGG